MAAFIVRRLLQAIIVMLVVALIAFLLFQYVGDPVSQMLGQDATPEDRARLRGDLGLDQPFYVQFGHFIGNAIQGDFGISLRQGRAVSTLDQGALAGDARARVCSGGDRDRGRYSDGRLHGAAARFVVLAFPARGIAGRDLAADISDRHSADPGVRRDAWRAAVLWARRYRAAWLVEHRPADDDRAGSI